ALVDEAVNIAGIKRYAADIYLNQNELPDMLPDTGKKVAIVGGGPAGLTAAYFLRRAGHMPTVFESMPHMGGLLRYGIPEYRLPKAVLDAELDILQKMGVVFQNNMTLGQDITLPALQAGYDSVIIGVGAGKSKPIWCDGEDATGVFGGIDFLKAVAEGKTPNIGRWVVVIGGSNTAMDAARTALRLGAEVFVSYRRTRQEMPAEQAEIEEALAEGVQLLFLTAPKEITQENGRATGMTLQKMTLGEPDASGRRSPVPLAGADEWVAADTIIGAIGQDVALAGLDPLENLKVDDSFRTQLPGVYAIGDATGKSWYAIDAIAHGRKVAAVVIGDMQPPWAVVPPVLVKDEKNAVDFAGMAKAPRENEATLHREALDFGETHADLTDAQAAAEAARCLACCCEAFHDCELLKLSNMYGAEVAKFAAPYNKKYKYEVDHRNPTIYRDMNKCVHCYLCVRACDQLVGADVLSAAIRGFECTIDTAFGEKMPERCNTCGKCADYCPTGALVRTGLQREPFKTQAPNINRQGENTC
ncbi:MAG: FAD-dependent oxidoreductase, partial [Defluviitaleaceae bacterium]|nr:FAD-dependent oxidoreductase [Defluviitaleaceae bacterium]